MNEPWEDLVVAVLAVSLYPIERVEPCRMAFREAGLFDPNRLAAESIQALTEELQRAGYDRGKLTWQFADRLISLGKHVIDGDQRSFERVLSDGSELEVGEALTPIYGIGPKVIRNYLELRANRKKFGSSDDRSIAYGAVSGKL